MSNIFHVVHNQWGRKFFILFFCLSSFSFQHLSLIHFLIMFSVFKLIPLQTKIDSESWLVASLFGRICLGKNIKCLVNYWTTQLRFAIWLQSVPTSLTTVELLSSKLLHSCQSLSSHRYASGCVTFFVSSVFKNSPYPVTSCSACQNCKFHNVKK